MLCLLHFRGSAFFQNFTWRSQNRIPGIVFAIACDLRVAWKLRKSYKIVLLVHFRAHAHVHTFTWRSQNRIPGRLFAPFLLQNSTPGSTFSTSANLKSTKIYQNAMPATLSWICTFSRIPWVTLAGARFCRPCWVPKSGVPAIWRENGPWIIKKRKNKNKKEGGKFWKFWTISESPWLGGVFAVWASPETHRRCLGRPGLLQKLAFLFCGRWGANLGPCIEVASHTQRCYLDLVQSLVDDDS